MKRTLAAAVLPSLLCSTVFAAILTSFTAPLDDSNARQALRDSIELRPLYKACHDIIEARLWPLEISHVAKVFGPRLETATYVEKIRFPADLVVPSFEQTYYFVDGLNHSDLHAVGDIGFVQFFYSSAEGRRGFTPPAVYFRADDNFVALKSTNDLPKRLDWDKAKFEALKHWIDEHLPSTDLGEVQVSVSSPKRIELGAGTGCIITVKLSSTQIYGQPNVTNYCYFTIYRATEAAQTKEQLQSNENRKNRVIESMQKWSSAGTNRPMAFSIDHKLYRVTPKFVE